MLLLDLAEVDHTGICTRIADTLVDEKLMTEAVKPQILRWAVRDRLARVVGVNCFKPSLFLHLLCIFISLPYFNIKYPSDIGRN